MINFRNIQMILSPETIWSTDTLVERGDASGIDYNHTQKNKYPRGLE